MPERLTKVTDKGLGEKRKVLHGKWLVEAELFAHEVDLGDRRVAREQHHGRIAGHAQRNEHERRHAPDDDKEMPEPAP